MIGWSYAASCPRSPVLDAPDVVHAACAGAPPTDWTLYDTHYTERYLGLDPEVLPPQRHCGGRAQSAPSAHAHPRLRRRQRHHRPLAAAEPGADGGWPPAHLPALTGITHMTNDETVAENLLILQRDFLYDALGMR